MGGEKDSNNSDIIRLRESRIKRVGGKLTYRIGICQTSRCRGIVVWCDLLREMGRETVAL